MAVVLSFSTRQSVVHSGTILSIFGTVTGDNSGGGVSGSIDINSLIPQNCVVSVLDVGGYTSDANTSRFEAMAANDEWEQIQYGLLIGAGGSSYNEIYSTTYSTSLQNNSFYHFPLYLGKPLKATKSFTFYFEANTNAKTYVAYIRLLVQPI